MNITQRCLNLQSEVLICEFFSITVTEFDTTCLAWHTPKVYEYHKDLGFEFTLNTKGDYLEATKDGIKIILSLNKPQ
jgi:hypothetical protein